MSPDPINACVGACASRGRWRRWWCTAGRGAHRRLLWLALAALAASGPAAGEPLAEWAPPDGLSPLMQTRLEHLERSRCVPDAAEVAWPAFPGAVLIGVDWGRMAPQCAPRDGWNELGGVVLATRAELPRVAAWYAERLADHVQYRATRGVLFVAAEVADFLWDRDYYKYPNVAVKPAPAVWAEAGYRTVIEFNRPAP